MLTTSYLQVQLLPLYGSMSHVIGQADRRMSNPESDTLMERDLRQKNSFQSKPHHFNKAYTAFMFQNYEEMKESYENFSKLKVNSGLFVFSSAVQTFYEGLMLFRMGRKENDTEWFDKGKVIRAKFEALALVSAWNFENKMFLLKAEEQYSLGNLDLAETLYDGAVYSAKGHRFVNEEALSNELAGLFFTETGREYEASVCYSHAIEKYREWEAFGKAKHLEGKVRDLK